MALLHASGFFVLAALACFTFQNTRRETRFRYALWAFAYCNLIELGRSFIPHYQPSGEDVLFNVMGLILGAMSFSLMAKFMKGLGTSKSALVPSLSQA
jgi:VanZ family protein